MLSINREEKSLRHVALVAKFLDDNKFQNQKFTKKRICTASNFIDLFQFHLICQKLAKFSWLNSKGPYISFEKGKRKFLKWFSDSMKRALEIGKFHVAVVQPRQRNVQNSVMHLQICFFVNKNLLIFCRSPSVAVVVGFVVIQK